MYSLSSSLPSVSSGSSTWSSRLMSPTCSWVFEVEAWSSSWNSGGVGGSHLQILSPTCWKLQVLLPIVQEVFFTWFAVNLHCHADFFSWPSFFAICSLLNSWQLLFTSQVKPVVVYGIFVFLGSLAKLMHPLEMCGWGTLLLLGKLHRLPFSWNRW